MSEMRQVRLPADLCTAAEKKFSANFSSVEELLVFLLKELVERDTTVLDEAERRAVEERLRDLGYI